jgi:hypothetical protein
MQVRHRAEEAPDPWNAIVQTRLLPKVYKYPVVRKKKIQKQKER